ncbi:DUF3575 domain-containing protein [Polaribacter aestuariivivens]|uniref:DUF3575 domain-containing protein n=1 Tax=Polaribacter aestuariivivens TaxID=2304626 RepID=A0A5S3N3Y1_9FLAO|nr:DUF3575 domain-containing protein [Polaribacter aestuariivivens]TMM30058.1 DUF3575 domain-containing protein [Polaribacter aestuariivivens]
MKKATLLVLLIFTSLHIVSQENEKQYPQDIDKSYELKLNTFSLIAISSLDVSYEKLINSESSYGVAIFYKFTDLEGDEIGFPKKFSVTPYYRWFFSESKYARGFFVEGFGMLNTYQDIFYNSSNNQDRVENATGFALGVSVGGKFVTKGGFSTEVYLGVGRNLIKGNNDSFDLDIVTRFGISLGYRF